MRLGAARGLRIRRRCVGAPCAFGKAASDSWLPLRLLVRALRAAVHFQCVAASNAACAVVNQQGPTTNKTSVALAATLASVQGRSCTVSSDARCTTAALTAVFGHYAGILAAYCNECVSAPLCTSRPVCAFLLLLSSPLPLQRLFGDTHLGFGISSDVAGLDPEAARGWHWQLRQRG